MSKLKIYQGVLCLEAPSPNGERWWYQPGKLAYSPVKISEIRRLQSGTIGVKKVLVVPVQVGSHQTLVAVNLPRSDLWTLKAMGMLPLWINISDEPPEYTPWPEYTRNGHF